MKRLVREKADQEGFAELTEAEHADFRHKKKILASCLSPDTEKPVPFYGRTSSFVPMNVPIIGGILMSAPTFANTVMW